MSSADVLPSAPPADEPTFTHLYLSKPPSQPVNAQNFRLTEISKIEKKVADEVELYRPVLTKNKPKGPKSS